jgi:hypothetical protein
MATESAPTRSPAAQNLWQLPVFLLGVASLVGVWHARPYLQASPAQRHERDLVAFKQVLEKNPYDRKQLLPLLQRVEANALGQEPDIETSFALGSAYVNLAELAPQDDDAKRSWETARKHLETAARGKLSDADTSKLQFRLGKSWANLGGVESEKIVEALGKNLLCGDDSAEGYRLLANEYLKVQPADLKKARDYLKEYLSRALPRTDPRTLHRSRLKLGELHTQLGELEEGRKVLARINEDAPVEVFVSSRLQLARGYQAEEDVLGTIQVLEEARKARNITPAQLAYVQYQLAATYLKANRTADSVALFDKLRLGSGDEAQAASIRLAELQLKDKDKEGPAKLLEGALLRMKAPEDYRNPLLPIDEARAIYEVAASHYRATGEFPLSIRVAKASGKIGEPGRERAMIVETLEAWGEGLEKQAAGDAGEAAKWKEAAQRKFREAATELEASFKEKTSAADKKLVGTDLARLLNRAGEQERARKLLDEIQGTETVVVPVPVPVVEAKDADWLQKGESALATGDRVKALEAFEKGSERSGPNQFRNRYQLARLLLDTNSPEQVEKAIKLLESIDGPEAEKDAGTHEKAAYLLGTTLFQRKDWVKAEYRLARAMQFYPAGESSTKARFLQARCHWYLASQRADKIRDLNFKQQALAKSIGENGGTPTDAENHQRKQLDEQVAQEEAGYNESLAKARIPFQEVEERLLRKKADGSLTPDEAKLLRQTSFAAAECSFYLGDYDDCVKRYEALADRYQSQVEGMIALSQLWQCYSYLKDQKKAEYIVVRMQNVFQGLKASDFDGVTEERKKSFWEKWLGSVTEK